MREQDLIITLIILAVSGISTLLQKRRQAREHRPFPKPPPDLLPAPPSRSAPALPAEPPPFDLEEQLRRIFEEESAPRPTPPAPPVIPTAPPVSPPLAEAVPMEVTYTETEEPAARALGRLPEAAQAYERASQLHESIAARIRRIDAATEHARPLSVQRPQGLVSPVAAAAVAQLRSRSTAQQALITSTILGPPKSLAPAET